MDFPTETDVLIVGAGPTGMTLALALADIGVRAVVLDKQAEGANTSRAVVIHARTLEVLAPLGVTEVLLSRALNVPMFRAREQDKVLLEIPFGQLATDYPFTLMLPQEQTEAILLAQLKAVGGHVVRPAEVVGVAARADGVEAEVIADGVSRRIGAKWIVGCDGGHSVVREAAGIGFEGAAYPEDFVLADVRMDWPLSRDEVSLFFAAEGLVVVAPLPDDQFRVVATVNDAPPEITAAFVQDLLDRRGPKREPGRIRDLLWTSKFHLQHRVADTAFKGRTLLCGDAAHVHSPAGGQGMNTGIQDAASLAAPLAEALTSGDTRDLTAWAARRHQIAKSVVGTTDKMTRAATLESGPLRLARNAALTLVGHIPAAREAIAQTLAELNYR